MNRSRCSCEVITSPSSSVEAACKERLESSMTNQFAPCTLC